MSALDAAQDGLDEASAALLAAASTAVADYSTKQHTLEGHIDALSERLAYREGALPEFLAVLQRLATDLGSPASEEAAGQGRRSLSQARASGANNGVAALVASIARSRMQQGMSTDEGRELELQVGRCHTHYPRYLPGTVLCCLHHR